MTTLINKSVCIFFLLSLIIILLAPTFSHSKVVKDISINSQPIGAKVFLLQGRKQTLIGTTPFIYKASFHSNISVIRMALSKSGYENHELKVSASQKTVNASLKPLPLIEDPASHKNPRHREIQKKVNAVIEPVIRELLEKPDLADIDSVDLIKIKEGGSHLYIELSLSMTRPKDTLKDPVASQDEMVAQKLWGQLGEALVLPVAETTRGVDDIDGILLEVRFNTQYTLFNVNHKVETTNETKCVPGYRYELGSDFYGNLTTRTIYEPCLHRKTETKTKVKFDPIVDRKKGKSIIRYFLPFEILAKRHPSEGLFEKISFVYTDAKGKELLRQGNLPNKIE